MEKCRKIRSISCAGKLSSGKVSLGKSRWENVGWENVPMGNDEGQPLLVKKKQHAHMNSFIGRQVMSGFFENARKIFVPPLISPIIMKLISSYHGFQLF